MTVAGDLRERAAFEQQQPTDSDYGIIADAWAEQFTCRAQFRYLRGSEPVIASRLVGVQPVVVTVRSTHLTRGVDSSWRVRNANTGTLMNIRSVTPDEKRAFIDILCDVGAA